MKNKGVRNLNSDKILTLDEVRLVTLETYFPNLKYLRKVNFDYPSIKGDFRIDHSCYCEETGHFTLTELSICYNQLAYTFFGYAAQEGLIGDYGEVSIEKFKGLRHRNMVIPKVDGIRFKRPINPREFYGSMNLKRARKSMGSGFFKTGFEFWDKKDGYAFGDITFANDSEV